MNDEMVLEYLSLLGCTDKRAVSVENLTALQRAHLERVPYNNFEILSGVVPGLDEGRLFDKIVRRRQGGYCFELNGLYAELLRKLGYPVKEYFARWHFGGSEAVPGRRHRIIEVQLGGKTFITDVSIGSAGSVIPFEFVLETVQDRAVRPYRFVEDETLGILLQAQTDQGWVPYYSFTRDPHFPRDFEYVNFYCAQHPESIFRTKVFMHRQTEKEQFYIEDLQQPGIPLHFCIRRSKTDMEKIPVIGKEQMAQILNEHFFISCEPEELTYIPNLGER